MNLEQLDLRNFRNYQSLQSSFSPGVNLIVGDNAQGKTNLLEAVYYLSTGRSFRTRREIELIRFWRLEYADFSGAVSRRGTKADHSNCFVRPDASRGSSF